MGKHKKVLQISRRLFLTCSIGFKNRIKYGAGAPRYAELIWVTPSEITKSFKASYIEKAFGEHKLVSGSVIGGDWDLGGREFDKRQFYLECKKHWIDGVPWVETNRYDKMVSQIGRNGIVDGCSTYEDVVARYERLDRLFAKAKKERNFMTQAELNRSRRFFAPAYDEIEVFIDRNGKPIHGRGGNHRVAIAKILKLEKIPAKLGAIHPDGLKYYKYFKINPNRDSLQADLRPHTI